jgi:hypothetical protein
MDSNTKFTPGPWLTDEEIEKFAITHAMDAAAPDMYEALVWAHSVLVKKTCTRIEKQECIQIIRAALAKAEGKA